MVSVPLHKYIQIMSNILRIKFGKLLDNNTVIKFFNGNDAMICEPKLDTTHSYIVPPDVTTISLYQKKYNTVIAISVSLSVILVFIFLIIYMTYFTYDIGKKDSLLEVFNKMKQEDLEFGSRIIIGDQDIIGKPINIKKFIYLYIYIYI